MIGQLSGRAWVFLRSMIKKSPDILFPKNCFTFYKKKCATENSNKKCFNFFLFFCNRFFNSFCRALKAHTKPTYMSIIVDGKTSQEIQQLIYQEIANGADK